MTIIRCEHDPSHPYVTVTRGVAQNRDLSYEALGLLTYLLSKPDDWKVVPEDLQREACGRNRVYKLLNELKEAGHITQERDQSDHTKPPMWGERVVHELPYPELRDTEPNPSIQDMASDTILPYPVLGEMARNPSTPYPANAISRNEGQVLNTDSTKYRKDTNTQNARAHEAKEFDDVPKHDRLELIRAWADNLSVAPVNVYNRDAYHRAAADLFRAGYRAPQVALFVKAKMNDAYWIGKTLSLDKVGELMPQWLLHNYGNGNSAHAPARASPLAPSTSAGAPTLRPVRSKTARTGS